MKYGVLFGLLTHFCCMIPEGNNVLYDYRYQQLFQHYLLLYVMGRGGADVLPAFHRAGHADNERQLHQQQRQEKRNKVGLHNQQQKLYKNNNRSDRPRHAQINKSIHQPRKHNHGTRYNYRRNQ